MMRNIKRLILEKTILVQKAQRIREYWGALELKEKMEKLRREVCR
jgi:hypothetical protein